MSQMRLANTASPKRFSAHARFTHFGVEDEDYQLAYVFHIRFLVHKDQPACKDHPAQPGGIEIEEIVLSSCQPKDMKTGKLGDELIRRIPREIRGSIERWCREKHEQAIVDHIAEGQAVIDRLKDS
jgi:hypothetical protein